mgnify:CR=1 FL=1
MSQEFDPQRLRTVHLVPITAYRSDGSLNLELQAEHLTRMYAAGMRVFLPAAGTSEFHSLSSDEVVELVRVTREATGPDAVVFAPLGLQVGEALKVAERSMESGADGVMFMPFSHPYLSDAGIQDYYRTVIDVVRCPTVFYKKGDLPSDELLLKLSADKRVVGVKYAVNNLDTVRRVILADRGRTEWICGSAERFAPYFMLAGSTGYTTGAGNICPHIVLAMHSALAAGEWNEAMRLQQIILPIEHYRARSGDSYNISMLKHALKMAGLDFGDPRPPQRRLTTEERNEIEQLCGPIFDAEQQMQQELRAAGLANH